MQFRGIELSALIKMAFNIAAADGKFVDEEKAAITFGMAEFGLDKDGIAATLLIAKEMDATAALATLSSMTTEQKKYATGFLAAVIAADGDVDSAEIKMWQLICTLASFPTMIFQEALKFWTSH